MIGEAQRPKVVRTVGVILIIVVCICFYIAYFSFWTDTSTRNTYDGFGRMVEISPFFIRFVLGEESYWAGLAWFIFDVVIFLGGIISGICMIKWSLKKCACK